MKKTLTLFLSFLFIMIEFSACKKKEIGTPGENEIFLLYKTFSPTSLVIKKGTTVTFTNKDNANHSVSSSSGLFNSGKIKSDESFKHTFNDAETYNFFCNYHSSQQEQGAVIVQ
ncbi:MAG: cupredoxin domain-containing protein [Bacteroidia bacterium]|nr:cupredoxin domain-containing protein [Bacteroidia bacterium]